MSRAERVLTFLEQQPNTWIEAIRFEPIGGRQAWRTAISEARALAHRKDPRWYIENRYRYIVIHADECPQRQRLRSQKCTCVNPQKWVLSEYMLVVPAEPPPMTLEQRA